MNQQHPSGSRALRARRLHRGHHPSARGPRSILPQRPPVTPADAGRGSPARDPGAPRKLPLRPRLPDKKRPSLEKASAGSPRGRAPPASPPVAEPPAARPSAAEHCSERARAVRARPRAGVVCRARRRGGSCEPAPPPLPASGDAPRRAAAAPPGSHRRGVLGPARRQLPPGGLRLGRAIPANSPRPAPPPGSAPARDWAPAAPAPSPRLYPSPPTALRGSAGPSVGVCSLPRGTHRYPSIQSALGGGEDGAGAAPALEWGNQKTRGREWKEEVRTPDGIPKLREPRDRQLPFPWEEGGARRSQAGNPDGRFLVLLRPWTDSRPQATCFVSAFGFSRRGMQGLD